MALTPEQMQEFQATFAMFDKHDRGYITTKDLKTVLKKLGKNLSSKDLKSIIKRVDTDDSYELGTLVSDDASNTVVNDYVILLPHLLFMVNEDPGIPFCVKTHTVKGFTTEKKIFVVISLYGDSAEKGNGKIDFDEFSTMMVSATRRGEDEEAMRDSFRVFDQDGNGVITKAELRQVMETLGEKLSDQDVIDMIKEADIDGDGQINYQEFVKMMFGK